jgi:hypothetical protein
VKVHLPTGQWPEAHSQDNAGVASGPVSECPWVAQPEPWLEPDRTSLESPGRNSPNKACRVKEEICFFFFFFFTKPTFYFVIMGYCA